MTTARQGLCLTLVTGLLLWVVLMAALGTLGTAAADRVVGLSTAVVLFAGLLAAWAVGAD